MTELANNLVFPVASWLLTYALHSTVLLGAALLAVKLLTSIGARLRELIIAVAVVGAVLTTSVQLAVSPVAYLIHTEPVIAEGSEGASAGDTGGSDQVGGAGADSHEGQSEEGVAKTVVITSSDVFRLVWAAALVTAWLAIVLYLSSDYAIKWRRFRQKINDRTAITSGPLFETVRELSKRAGVKRNLRLSISRVGNNLMAIGFSEICLPERLISDLSLEEQRSVIAHELAHLQRLDPIRLIAMSVIEVILFFQPLNLLANRRLQAESEYLTDELALRFTGDPDTLASSLLKFAVAWRRCTLAPQAAGLRNGGPDLSERIKRILGWKGAGPHKAISRYRILVSLGALFLVAWATPDLVISIDRLGDSEVYERMRPELERMRAEIGRIRAKPRHFRQAFSPPDLEIPAPITFGERAEETDSTGEAGVVRGHWVGGGWIKRVFSNGVRVEGEFSNVTLDRRYNNVYRFDSGGGHVIVRRHEWHGFLSYRFEIHSDSSGETEKHYFVNGAPRPFDAEAESILKISLLELLDFATGATFGE